MCSSSQKLVKSSKTTTVESNMKSVYLVCEDSPQRVPGLWRLSTTCFFSFALYLVLFLPSFVHWLRCFHFLKFNRRLCSALNSAKHVRCGGSSTSFVSRACHSTIDGQCTWRMSFWACMWDIPGVTDAYVHTYVRTYARAYPCTIARIDPYFKASR